MTESSFGWTHRNASGQPLRLEAIHLQGDSWEFDPAEAEREREFYRALYSVPGTPEAERAIAKHGFHQLSIADSENRRAAYELYESGYSDCDGIDYTTIRLIQAVTLNTAEPQPRKHYPSAAHALDGLPETITRAYLNLVTPDHFTAADFS